MTGPDQKTCYAIQLHKECQLIMQNIMRSANPKDITSLTNFLASTSPKDFSFLINAQTILWEEAIAYRSLEMISALLKWGLDINMVFNDPPSSKKTKVTLEIADSVRKTGGVQLDNIKINEIDADESQLLPNFHEHTPLTYAVVKGDSKIVKFLLEKGANPNHVVMRKETNALFLAIDNAQIAMVDLLLKHNIHGDFITPAFHKAICNNSEVIASSLIQHKPSIINEIKKSSPLEHYTQLEFLKGRVAVRNWNKRTFCFLASEIADSLCQAFRFLFKEEKFFLLPDVRQGFSMIVTQNDFFEKRLNEKLTKKVQDLTLFFLWNPQFSTILNKISIDASCLTACNMNSIKYTYVSNEPSAIATLKEGLGKVFEKHEVKITHDAQYIYIEFPRRALKELAKSLGEIQAINWEEIKKQTVLSQTTVVAEVAKCEPVSIQMNSAEKNARRAEQEALMRQRELEERKKQRNEQNHLPEQFDFHYFEEENPIVDDEEPVIWEPVQQSSETKEPQEISFRDFSLEKDTREGGELVVRSGDKKSEKKAEKEEEPRQSLKKKRRQKMTLADLQAITIAETEGVKTKPNKILTLPRNPLPQEEWPAPKVTKVEEALRELKLESQDAPKKQRRQKMTLAETKKERPLVVTHSVAPLPVNAPSSIEGVVFKLPSRTFLPSQRHERRPVATKKVPPSSVSSSSTSNALPPLRTMHATSASYDPLQAAPSYVVPAFAMMPQATSYIVPYSSVGSPLHSVPVLYYYPPSSVAPPPMMPSSSQPHSFPRMKK